MKKLVMTLTGAVVILLTLSCKEAKQQTVVEESLPIVKVAEATIGTVPKVVDFYGNIEPFKKNNISSSTAQRIDEILVEVGDIVKKGQLLVRMENINYEQARIQLENLKIDLERTEALYKSGAVSAQAYDQLKAQVDVMEESISNLSKNTNLHSPIEGIVSARNFDKGDLTMGQPILTVMQLKPVKIIISISEEYFPLINIGTPVSITLDVYKGMEFGGEVSLIYPTIDQSTRTFKAQVTIANDKMLIRPGMFARAKVDLGTEDQVIIPDKAVIKQSGTNNKYVYVLGKDNIVTYTQVELGKRFGTGYEVLSGLKAGDIVVTAGQVRLLDQVKVTVDKSDLF